MEKKLSYTKQDKELALQTSLTQLVSSMGFTLKKTGRTSYIKEMDSCVIFNDHSWSRFSKHEGGTQIDFLLKYGKAKTVPEAIHQLLEFQGLSPENRIVNFSNNAEINERKIENVSIPLAAKSYRRAYAYLIKYRGLSQNVVNYFVKNKIMYEENNRHNIVFVGRDSENKIRYATLRGTCDMYGKKFRGECPGSNKAFGVNIINKNSNKVKVFEAPIDLMSYLDITGDYDTNKLVLGCLADNALKRFLEDNKNITDISFCLDNDEPAKEILYGKVEVVNGERKEKMGYIKKYSDKGYFVKDECAPKIGDVKDYNEFLVYLKINKPESVAVLNATHEHRKAVIR